MNYVWVLLKVRMQSQHNTPLLLNSTWRNLREMYLIFQYNLGKNIIDYDSMEKCNELESIDIVLEKDEICAEALNAVDLDEEFHEEDVYSMWI